MPAGCALAPLLTSGCPPSFPLSLLQIFDFSFEHWPLSKTNLQRLMFEEIAHFHPGDIERERRSGGYVPMGPPPPKPVESGAGAAGGSGGPPPAVVAAAAPVAKATGVELPAGSHSSSR